MLRSIVRLATSAAREEAAVVIPVYRSLVTPEEKISYDRALTVFKKKPIVLVAPEGLDTAEFARGPERLRVERFDRAWFQGQRSYSRLLLSPAFYERFLPYEYILICQTDAFVFSDCLSGWCGRGYDYIGAPWVGLEKEMAQEARDRVLIRRMWPWLHERTNAAVGNGGFSLRRTRAFLASILALRFGAQQRRNEDLFWSHSVPSYNPWFRIPTTRVALEFAFELSPSRCYEINSRQLPFGCHAWEKHEPDFWRPFIEGCGYSL